MSEPLRPDICAAWEAAYQRFETPAEERRKFRRRLRAFGVEQWPRDLAVVELFCGRGGGLQAWSDLGFTRLIGVDVSASLLARVDDQFQTIVADARALPLEDHSADLISIHGGLHHLPQLPDDLHLVLLECRRVLKSGGWLLLVEPWPTPFLSLVHAGCRQKWLRRLWPRLDALAEMIELEAGTYFAWLGTSATVRETIARHFPPHRVRTRLGKLHYLARRP